MRDLIVYALSDPRTHQIRYVGASTVGLIRPFSHRDKGHSTDLHAWLRDLASTDTHYSVIILARPVTTEQLAMFEAHWIAMGVRFGWPLLNKSRPKDTLPALEPMNPNKRWDVRAWRRDPEVRARLESAKAKNKSQPK